MKKMYIQSRLLRWLLATGLLLLLVLSLLRVAFVIAFRPVNISWKEMGPSFLMGLRYDTRFICVLLLPLLLIGSFKYLNPFESKISRKIMIVFTGIYIFVLTFFYSIDFAHFSYLSQRLNAQVLNYLDDKNISLRMVWQSYPVIKIVAGMILVTLVLLWIIRKLFKKVAAKPFVIKKANRLSWSIFLGFLFAFGIWGRFSHFPLRWSDAFSLQNDFEANTALNPLQSFLSSMTFRQSVFDIKKTKHYYSLMTDQLGVQQKDSVMMNYERIYNGTDSSLAQKPNIVLVICESFSAYKSSMWGNPLNTTPFFNQLCQKGVFFSRCFTPAFGTARGIWATVTGIPDVEIPKTASRNPLMVDQATILNDFKGYEKMYFIGGSASWANIRGLLMDNIEDLHLYEEQNYKSPKLDVWGISDKNLLLESADIMEKQKTPFFSIIQTADNHRPYIIPKEDQADFKKVSFPPDTLKKYGFISNDELNAFRYSDYCFQLFIEHISQKKYFANTIFVFVGDHGIRGYAGDMFPKAWNEQGLTCEHVPLLFYSPARLLPRKITNISSQLDILPTVASLAGIAYHNYALGRNLLDTVSLNQPEDLKNSAFIIDHDIKQIGLVTNRYYCTHSLVSGKKQVVSVIDNNPVADSPGELKRIDSIQQLTEAYFETSRYLLFNNKKKKPGGK